jgi:hypothetical protein
MKSPLRPPALISSVYPCVILIAVLLAFLAACAGCKGKTASRSQVRPSAGAESAAEGKGHGEAAAQEGGTGELAIPEAIYPALAQQGNSSQDFVPKGWRLECDRKGDISKDGIPDLALVLRQEDPANRIDNTGGLGPDTLDTNPRILAVAVGLPGSRGYRLVTANHELIPRHTEPNLEDYLGACPEIKKGTLEVGIGFAANAGTWWTWNSTFIFRYQDARLRLIGYEHNVVKKNSGYFHSRSLNYLTGRMEFQNGTISDDSLKSESARLTGTRMVSIDDIGDGSGFEDEGRSTEASEEAVAAQEEASDAEPEPKSSLHSVAWTGRQLVAVGSDSAVGGLIMTSSDGVTWVRRNSGTRNGLASVIWLPEAKAGDAGDGGETGRAGDAGAGEAKGRLIAVGENGTVLVSSDDGLSWKGSQPTDRSLGIIAWTGRNGRTGIGKLLALETENSGDSAVVLTSSDGRAWSISALEAKGHIHGLTWMDDPSGGRFVAVGTSPESVLTSQDGRAWSKRPQGARYWLEAAAWTGSQLVAVGTPDASDTATAVLTSPDGVAWTKRKTGTGNLSLGFLAWTGKKLIAVGSFGAILTSPDGIAWTQGNSGTQSELYSATWMDGPAKTAPGQWVVVGAFSEILTSRDGLTWTRRYKGD